MEKLLSNELARYIIILGAVSIGLTAIFAKMLAKLKGSFKPYQKSTILYMLAFVLFFGVVGVTALPVFFHSTMTTFIFLQAYFLLLGSFHVYFLKNSLAWGGDQKLFLVEIIFTIQISLFGCIAFLFVYNWLNKNGMQYILSASILFFIIPFFFYYAFTRAVAIPPKILKQWFYPVSEEIEEPDDNKMRNMLVISFLFQKQETDNRLTNFHAKAPRDMDFGDLFYYFINDYNEMHKNSKIQYSNGSGHPQGWIFYKKPKWHSIVTKYIDTEKTIFSNNIQDNDVIICSRSHV